MSSFGVFGKNIENKVGAVDNLAFKYLRDVFVLRRRKFIVENGGINLVSLNIVGNLLHLAFTQVDTRIRVFNRLGKTADANHLGSFGKKFKFV